MCRRKSDIENNIVNNIFKLWRHVEDILVLLFLLQLNSEALMLAKFLEMHSKKIYGFIKLISVILISPSNFLFYPFLPITMEKIHSEKFDPVSSDSWWSLRGLIKRICYFAAFFGQLNQKLWKCRVSNKFKTLRVEGNATNSEIMVFNFSHLGKYWFLRDFNMCKWPSLC